MTALPSSSSILGHLGESIEISKRRPLIGPRPHGMPTRLLILIRNQQAIAFRTP